MISEQEFREGNGLILSLPLAIKKPGFSSIKDALSRLKQFLATESSLKIMKNTFYFTVKALFILKVFKFLS